MQKLKRGHYREEGRRSYRAMNSSVLRGSLKGGRRTGGAEVEWGVGRGVKGGVQRERKMSDTATQRWTEGS